MYRPCKKSYSCHECKIYGFERYYGKYWVKTSSNIQREIFQTSIRRWSDRTFIPRPTQTSWSKISVDQVGLRLEKSSRGTSVIKHKTKNKIDNTVLLLSKLDKTQPADFIRKECDSDGQLHDHFLALGAIKLIQL